MKNKIFKNKFLFILALVLFILFILLINNSFATGMELDANNSVTINGYTYVLDNIEGYDYYLYNYNEDTLYRCIHARSSHWNCGGTFKTLFSEDNTNNKINIISRCEHYNDYANYVEYKFNKSNGLWEIGRNVGGTYSVEYSFDEWSFIYTPMNVYTDSNYSILWDCNSSNFFYNNVKKDKIFYCFPDKEYVTLENFKFSQILSVAYSSENYNNYNAQISLDGENWTFMSKEYADLDNSTFVFYCDVFENGTYQVRVFDDNTGQYIYDSSVEVDNIPFSVTLEPSEDTDEPIIARTNTFSFDVSLKYSFHFSTDKVEWTRLNHSTEAPSETEEVRADDTYYWTRIFKNGTYYFRFTYYDEEYDENGKLISATPNYFYVTKKVENIMVEDYMSDDYIFKPIISLSFNEETQAFVVRTQSILLDKALNLNCFYVTYEKIEGFNPNEQIEDDVITGWNKMEIDFENNIYMGTSDAYFYFEIPIINATDTNYKIAFYNYISEKSSEIVYYDFIYKDAKDYVENDLKAHLGINVRLNDFLKNVESHFGILGFPMAVVRNFCNKILTLQVKEPIIYIPELYEPFYHNKIYNGTSFNFNSLLVNDSVIFIHEFYLTIVDIIFIYLFLVYCVKTLKTFISNINND